MNSAAGNRCGRLLSRRRVFGLGAAGLLGAGGIGSLLSLFDRVKQDATPADVFKGDAPKGEVWAAWRARGWVREAAHYLKLDGHVQCKVCPNNCLLRPGDRSHCRNKVNQGGTLYTMAYANPCTFHVDPVEKKPLFHFLPGSLSFSLATSGCVFRCLNCQNWEISQKKPEETKDPTGPELRLKPPLPARLSLSDMRRLSLFPEDLPAVARALACPSISYTYSEPTAYYEYALDSCKAARAAGVKNVLVTCGSIEERSFGDLARWVDAAHVDLKGFEEHTYRQLNSGRLAAILRTLEDYRRRDIWFEVINLIVPTYTDNLESIKKMCGWMVQKLGPDTPLHFSRFRPEHKLTHLPPTPVETLVKARDLARAAGLHFVYLGNVIDVADAGTTFCPTCHRPVVERDIYAVTALRLDQGKCRHCGSRVAGVWT